jgi:hypothetical protein
MMALAMVGKGEITLGVGISLGTHGARCTSLSTFMGDSISLGGLDILSQVTLFGFERRIGCFVNGILFSILSILCNASYSTIPLLFSSVSEHLLNHSGLLHMYLLALR